MTTSSNENIFRVTGPFWRAPPATGGFPSQRPVERSFDIFFDLHLNKLLSKQSRRRWYETLSRSLRRHCNGHIGCPFIRFVTVQSLLHVYNIQHSMLLYWLILWLPKYQFSKPQEYGYEYHSAKGPLLLTWLSWNYLSIHPQSSTTLPMKCENG